MVRHAGPPAEARAPRDDFLQHLDPKRLKSSLITNPPQVQVTALSVELPPLRLEDAMFCSGERGVGAAKIQHRRHASRRCLLYTRGRAARRLCL